jgi:tRNA(fMet)-specific endonuclease VapC
MAVFLLDTDILSLYQRNHVQVLAALTDHASDPVAVSTITLEEQFSGWSGLARSAKTHQQQEQAARLLAAIVASWNRFALVPITEPALRRFEQLVRMKLNVRYNDLRIAAIALEMGATVVTRNGRDFGRVPGLAMVIDRFEGGSSEVLLCPDGCHGRARRYLHQQVLKAVPHDAIRRSPALYR